MKMKKLIAAISAAAVAVSAMATTISAAFTDQTLTYSLVEHLEVGEQGVGSVVLTKRITFTPGSLMWDNAGLFVTLFDNTSGSDWSGLGEIKEITVQTSIPGKQSYVGVYQTDPKSVNYSKTLADAIKAYQNAVDSYDDNDNFAARTGDNIILPGFHIPFADLEAGQTTDILDSQTMDVIIGIKLDIRQEDLSKLSAAMTKGDLRNGMIKKVCGITGHTDEYWDVCAQSVNLFVATSNDITDQSDFESMNGRIAGFNGINQEFADRAYARNAQVFNYADYHVDYHYITDSCAGSDSETVDPIFGSSIPAFNSEVTHGQFFDLNNRNNDANPNMTNALPTNGHLSGRFTAGSFNGAPAKVQIQVPYRTYVNPLNRSYNMGGQGYDNILWYLSYGGHAGIFNSLSTKNSESKGFETIGDRYYTNVLPVINDAVRNYDNVSFRFNSAKSNILFERKSGADHPANAQMWYYTSKGTESEDNWYVTAEYKLFGQHQYGLFSPWTSNAWNDVSENNNENSPMYTGYTNYGWEVGMFNLYNSALIVNGAYTMSLSDTQNYKYGNDWIEFDLEDAMNPNMGASTFAFTDYVQMLQLATSDYWFWDNMVITLAANTVETPDLTPGAPAEEETEIPFDFDDDDDIVADDDDDDDFVGDDDDDDDFMGDDDDDDDDFMGDDDDDTTGEVPQDEKNPNMGNAPVALAVIPVALAAAAIIAKKRK